MDDRQQAPLPEEQLIENGPGTRDDAGPSGVAPDERPDPTEAPLPADDLDRLEMGEARPGGTDEL